ncbi:MAG TPA: death-on-curing protein, partial [Candidatus Paceibacterota bacterium]|nr:death-on-curing protein [Candidatus Paceibacterota bacterium]
VDGNKRSGALSFIWFLKRNRINGVRKINPSALTAITLQVAESNPKDKDQLIALITNLLK